MSNLHEYTSLSRLSEAFAGFSNQNLNLDIKSQEGLDLFIFHCLKNSEKNRLFIFDKDKTLSRIQDRIFDLVENFTEPDLGRCAFFPSYDFWSKETFENPSQIKKSRIDCLSKIHHGSKTFSIFTSIAALTQYSARPDQFKNSCLTLKIGNIYEQDQLIADLRALSYQQHDRVEESKSFAIRGSIIDIFSSASKIPFRLEFFADELVSIRLYAVDTQISLQNLTDAIIPPAEEFLLETSPQNTQNLYDILLNQQIDNWQRSAIVEAFSLSGNFAGLDLFRPALYQAENTLFDHLDDSWQQISFYKKDQIEQQQDFWKHLNQIYLDQNLGQFKANPSWHINESTTLIDRLTNRLNSPTLILKPSESKPTIKPNIGLHEGPKLWADFFSDLIASQKVIIILCDDLDEIKSIASNIKGLGLKVISKDTKVSGLDFSQWHSYAPGLHLRLGHLTASYFEEDLGIRVFCRSDLYLKNRGPKRSASSQLKEFLSHYSEIKAGDLVVHIQHGIGRYLGIKSLEIKGIASDFLQIEYLAKDHIYLPIENISLLQKYTQGSSQNQSLDRLGSQSTWQKRKSSSKRHAENIASQLIAAYAKRKIARPKSLSVQSDLYQRFVGDFPYQETPDQKRAIDEVESDLTNHIAMDRLIVGDVGFGKTEVALRAAMLSVINGYQVIVLSPTTVLCYQHFLQFRKRMENYGVEVRQMSRFVSTKEQTLAIKAFAEGRVDILVGTHRILSKDVEAKNLGLVIIDEEQRFGVKHKEKLRSMRDNVDILTLTATPIPRTLHMASIGLRDISIIASPPLHRLPIKTKLLNFDENTIAQAIKTEIDRGGQVFFVHNRVETIEQVGAILRKNMPRLSFQIAHGQMNEKQLEKIMLDFSQQKFTLLLCTTIIESGLDLPNANTIIVNHADHFGLAQLYQLRGRIGRSSTQAYAYLLVDSINQLSVEAESRLDVLTSIQDLNAGFKIANHDLELRGAGNLLGSEQSGQVDSIGLELYSEYLEEAIAKLRGQNWEEKGDCELKLQISAKIHPNYMKIEQERLHFYKQIFTAPDAFHIHDIMKVVKDRFGAPPQDFINLCDLACLKLSLIKIHAIKISQISSLEYQITFANLKEQAIKGLMDFVKENKSQTKLSADFKLQISLEEKDGPLVSLDEWMQKLRLKIA